MAKLKKKPIILDNDVKINLDKGWLSVSGVKGSLTLKIPQDVEVEMKDNLITLTGKNKNTDIAILGLYYSLIRNMLVGVKTGWQKTLEMVGVGFRAQTDGKKLTLNVGFSHPVEINSINDISFKVEENKIIVEGMDKYLVGEIAATIRRVKPPEPYKGKGIKYLGEKIRKKAGKAAKAVGGALGK
ncbi:50S ribosomal protein L6 [Candidatus Gottesmanbacteria bacterium RBG_16_37_8]|uniref:50S ribosomal protein L6 n=1 Tax=Candidatus Gottesmanbacteria bacterium RBG_16_37_8 TaxID=1798371 RepID=A0A1F5YV25_9BACT|nr:MAG: 50S ribosomal protein L6 [Candidatus Gottesmanbacteria bacterium RBG_16_37_8]